MLETDYQRYIYWVPALQIDEVKQQLKQSGYRLASSIGSQCEVLKVSGKKLGYGTPELFGRLCKRQGSWYRKSDKAGSHVLVSDHPLGDEFSPYLDAKMSASDFQPQSLPNKESLEQLIDSDDYRSNRPDEWERPGAKDSLLFKTMFTFTGFWGWGDNLKTAWLNHRANHANFLAKTYTTELDGAQVPYTVSENDAVCSSCIEFLNIISNDTRKLVRACPGSITIAGVEKDVYYDVIPVSLQPRQST